MTLGRRGGRGSQGCRPSVEPRPSRLKSLRRRSRLAGLPPRAPDRASREETAEEAEARGPAVRGSHRASRDFETDVGPTGAVLKVKHVIVRHKQIVQSAVRTSNTAAGAEN